ncbi:MAG: KH domain-containing protein [Thermoleophilaceae bacterium]|nr:KH domain-containing protein [Thermoleophilaceae bacterium]
MAEVPAAAEGRGETLGEAKWSAVKELGRRFPGLTADHVRFEVLSEASADADALVRAEVDEEGWRQAADLRAEPAERVRSLVNTVCAGLGLRASVEVDEDEEELRATVNGEDLGLLIGKRGATIDALQHLALRAAFRGEADRRRVVVDAAGYRERREAVLHRAAEHAVSEALDFGRPVELEPMRPAERKVVHLHLRERTEVETHSEGDEPDRRLVVTPVRRSPSAGAQPDR